MPWRGDDQPTVEEEANLPPGRQLLKMIVGRLTDHIDNVMEVSREGTAGRGSKAMPLLRLMQPEQVAYITARYAVNSCTRHVSMANLSRQVAEALRDHLNYDSIKRNEPAFFKSLMRANKKAGNYGSTWRTKIRKAMKTVERLLVKWSVNDAIQIGTKCIEMLADAVPDLFVIEREANPKTGRQELVLRPTQKLVDWLEKQHARCELLNPIHMPMIVEPRPWTTPFSGGYLTNKVWMVKGVSKEYMQELATQPMPAVYDSLNAVQSTRWQINQPVLEIARQVWEAGSSLGDLPRRDDLPLPPRPEDIDTNEQALLDWKRKAAAVYEENARQRSKRIAMSQVLWVAEKFVDEEAIWFPHNLDFRGRVYPIPTGGPSPQGDDIQKALLRFAEGKPLGKDGADWLAIHIANLFGIDKVPFEERIAWVMEHDALLVDSGENPLDGARLWTQADSPYCALAACIEWAGYRRHGEGFVSHIPIALDGSNSGLQHFSAMLRDPQGAACVNLVPSAKPADIYSQVAAVVQRMADAAEEPEGLAWANGKVIRRIAKRPVMTYCYSATRFGMQEMILQELTKLDLELRAQGKPPHLEGVSNYDAAAWLSHRMFSAIGEVVSAASEAMWWIKQAAKLLGNEGKPIRWTSPIGFPVLQDYQTMSRSRATVFMNGQRVDFTLEQASGVIDTNGQVSAVAPNFVHSCDASHLMRVATASWHEGIRSLAVIHDSFGTHACDTAKLSSILRETMVEQYTPDILANLRDEVLRQLEPANRKELPQPPRQGSLPLDGIRDALYAFA
jgi:DNA-directed RNA polymerase